MIAYCDYIAHTIKKTLVVSDEENMLSTVGSVKLDLHPEQGYFLSTKKTIEVVDKYGKQYKITVEEV